MAETKGIDVSHWTYPTNWRTWLDNGFVFGYMKVTQGTQFADSKWKLHHKEATDEGTYVGAYHYFKADTNGAVQANYFWNEAKNHKWDMRPVVDAERYYNQGHSQAVFAARLRNCLVEVERLFGIRPMIYTSKSMWHELVGSVGWATAYDLWVAHYTTYPIPLIPDDWRGKGWTMWQYIDRPRDQNRFDGGLPKFLEWMGKDIPPIPPVGDVIVKLSYTVPSGHENVKLVLEP